MIYAEAHPVVLREMIEERLAQAPPSLYQYPLGYITWTADEILAALDCLCDRNTTMWTKVEAFESEFVDYLKASSYAVMVNSGSSADLVMMLVARELGLLKRGDEILIPAVTWPTQAWAAIEAGFSVKFVDVDVSTLNTSPAILEAAITSKTKAIFLVHLMGNPCDMDAIQNLANQHNLFIFEDCCEALGASFGDRKVGTFGMASAFSFFASHHISTMEGGMIATSNPEFAEGCRLMRAHGWARDLKYRIMDVDVLTRYSGAEDPRYLFMGMGFNFRPTELQGAMGSVQLEKLDTMNGWRETNARIIHDSFRVTNGHTMESLMPTSYKATPAWFALPFVMKEDLPYTRKDVALYLKRYGVDTRPIVGGNLARHPGFWKYPDIAASVLRGANAIHDRGFYIGLPPFETSMNGIVGLLSNLDCYLREPPKTETKAHSFTVSTKPMVHDKCGESFHNCKCLVR